MARPLTGVLISTEYLGSIAFKTYRLSNGRTIKTAAELETILAIVGEPNARDDHGKQAENAAGERTTSVGNSSGS